MKKLWLWIAALAVSMMVNADQVWIMVPDAMARDNADQLTLYLKKNNIKGKVVTASEFAAAPGAVPAVVGMGIGNFAPEVWQALEKRQAQGGKLIFQGKKENRDKLTDDTMKKLEKLFGVKYLGYAADPSVGKGTIQKFMFVKPDESEIWGAEHPPLFAAYTGEAFALQAADGGKAIGSWVRRDRETEDGPAVIAKGSSVFVGYYPWDLAAKGDKDNLPSHHAGIMLIKFLGKSSAPAVADAKPKRYQEPLNMCPVTPKFQTPRSMWLWNIDYALNPKERALLLEFTAGRHISRIYLCTSSARAFEGKSREQLRTFIREANQKGIKIEALDGWKQAILPEDQPKFLAALQRVIDFNKSVNADERFAGFQSDVEPVTMKEYHASPEARRRFDRMYVELHAKCAELVKQSGMKDFVFGMATNEHLDRDIKRPERHVEWQGRTCSVIEHLMEFVDYFALMSYHDTAPRIIAAAEDEVELADKHKIKAWVGVETLDVMQLFGGSRSLSFYEEGLEYMEDELEKVYKKFRNDPGFGGIAIHHYESYRRMTNGPRDMNLVPPPPLVTGKTYRADSAEYICHGKKEWHDKKDLSAAFRFDWNENELLIDVKVTDDVLHKDFTGVDLWKSDHLEFWFQMPETKQLIQLGIGLAERDNIYVWYPQELSEEQRAAMAAMVKAEIKTKSGGYEVKCRIPAALLGLKKFGKGDKLPVLMEVGDTDDAANTAKVLMSLTPGRDREDVRTYSVLELKGE